MKKKNIYKWSILLGLVGLTTSCSKILDEEPRTVFTTEYLKTSSGIQNAVNALYSGMRFNYGPMGAMLIMNNGTDEITSGDQGFNQTGEVQLGNYTINSDNGHILTPWNRNFSHINLANAVINFAPEVNVTDNVRKTLLAEAHYLRGLYYFLLVQQFGAVPLDLGSGELAFNQSAYQGFNRLPVNDLFVKNYREIIADLKYATENLPDQRPTGAFKLSKSAAFHMLSKAYLYRGYSTAKQATDFDSAYLVAKHLIDNKSTYGTTLLQNYADVHREDNDYNSEILFSIERVPGNHADNEVNNPSSEFTNKANISNNFFNCNYPTVQVPAGSGVLPIPDRVLNYGRPLRQLCPTPYTYNVAFLDKYYDSRYNSTFRTVWLTTVARTDFAVGDTAFVLAPSDFEATLMTGKKYRVIPPSQFYLPSNPALQIYPNLKKYDDNKRATVNDVSGRPFVVAKLSEVYLIAAEAAMKTGKTAEALAYITTLRKRAAYRTGLSVAELALREEQMTKRNAGTAQTPNWVTITAADLTTDFIMEERTRELFGESIRWADLACRGLLVDRVKRYNALGAANIKDHHVLRPIPQTQLNAMNDPNKSQYQNPGYTN